MAIKGGTEVAYVEFGLGQQPLKFSYLLLTISNPDPGGPKAYGSYESGTLEGRLVKTW